MSKFNLPAPVRVALWYLLIATLWVLLSDRLLDASFGNSEPTSTFQTIKGLIFVVATALALYLLMRREMRRMELKNEELKGWGHKLESRVSERTAALSAANQRLQSLDTFKSKMIAEISHELRSPITSIGLKIELMERVDSTRRTQYVVELKEQILLLRSLLNDVTDIALAEHGEMRELEPVDLKQLTRQIVEEHLPLAEAAGLTLYHDVDTDIPLILGRHNQLTRMLTNLVTNAIKYTSDGWVRLSVTVDSAGAGVMVRVQDTGIGIEPDAMAHLFDRFYRSEQVREQKIPGSGLGLSIVKEIVEAHQGTISVESTPEVGSIFVVRLSTGATPSNS